jgi:hypothetical protein
MNCDIVYTRGRIGAYSFSHKSYTMSPTTNAEKKQTRKVYRSLVNKKLTYGKGKASRCKVNKVFGVEVGGILEAVIVYVLEEVRQQFPSEKTINSAHIVKTIEDTPELKEVFKGYKFVLVNEEA